VNAVSQDASGYVLSLDTQIYSLDAVKKVAYKFADRASIIINPGADSNVSVVFNFVGGQSKNDPEQVIGDFCNELLDQDLRQIIRQETGALRNLILAHAFSGTSLAQES